ncbi:hypothetical protein PL373_13570 [Tenacibaculum maritimum]|nr:hypothetical protein [Tenacibaculum maritimum]MDB0602158.1 hypothetical protein [Tenacibaculum maritimum]MDB0613834.1 hypothetical protein [Tenacibaculum maritimum]
MDKIKLNRVRDNQVFEFNQKHALALLRRNSKDWVIADDKYELKDNEIIRKPNKKNTRKSETQEGDK